MLNNFLSVCRRPLGSLSVVATPEVLGSGNGDDGGSIDFSRKDTKNSSFPALQTGCVLAATVTQELLEFRKAPLSLLATSEADILVCFKGEVNSVCGMVSAFANSLSLCSPVEGRCSLIVFSKEVFMLEFDTVATSICMGGRLRAVEVGTVMQLLALERDPLLLPVLMSDSGKDALNVDLGKRSNV